MLYYSFVSNYNERISWSIINPKCLCPVCKEPPYKVEESGYAGFLMPIEVYFKNRVRTQTRVEELQL